MNTKFWTWLLIVQLKACEHSLSAANKAVQWLHMLHIREFMASDLGLETKSVD
jgi:hypothetical protein